MSTLILVPTSGTAAAKDIASYVVKVATSLGANIEVLHILREGESESDGDECAAVFKDAAGSTAINIRSNVRLGGVAETIASVAEEHQASLVVMGASRGRLVEDWLSADVMDQCKVPVLVVPHCFRLHAEPGS